jgi:hypothetical protein
MAIWRGTGGPGDATTDAANESSAAATSATNAANSASAAASSATAAASSATNAATSATNAASSATSASSSATSASTSATNAASSATNAATSETNAAASYDSFDDRYLGAKSSAPTVDNDGDALLTGALYWNTTDSQLYVWDGSAWNEGAFSASSAGVSSFNTRTGAVTLSSTDVNTALGSDAVLDSDIGATVQAYSSVLAATTASYTTAEETKLAGIETAATADQTGAEIKAAYELEANAFTDAQFTKLAGIETAATADQTAAEIKTAYESNLNTNAFTDAEKTKLSGIETGADVTDTLNVTAAGALMDSEVTNLAQVKAFSSADYATAAQGTLANSAIQPADNISTLTNDSGYVTPSSTATFTNKAGNISQWTNDSGYLLGTSTTGSAIIPVGTTAQRDASPSTGYFRFNTTDGAFEGYDGSAWGSIGSSYTNSDVDTHLNTSSATTGQVLSWNGSDYAWITSSGGVTSFNTRTGAVTLTSADVNTALGSDAVLDSDIGSTVQAYSTVLQNTTASYTTAEQTKLSGIETGATADQTAGEIKTAYESNANTNAYTDAEQTKLSGIETGATADKS